MNPIRPATRRFAANASLVAAAVISVSCTSSTTTAVATSSLANSAGTGVACPRSACPVVDGVELVVRNVDQNAPAAPGVLPIPADQHYVSVDVTFIDREGQHLIDGSNFGPLSGVTHAEPQLPPDRTESGMTGAAGIGLADEAGPESGTTTAGSASVSWHDAVAMGTTCGMPSMSSASLSSAAARDGAMELAEPPPRALQPGEGYGPTRLCFQVSGPIHQRMTLVWVPAPLSLGSPQPAAQFVPLS